MKKNITISLIISSFLFLSSCNSEKIKKLEEENKNLKAQIIKQKNEQTINSQIILLPESIKFKKNDKNKITLFLSEIQKYPDFDLYLANDKFEYDKKDKISYKKITENKFEFDYIPKSLNDSNLNIVAHFGSDTLKIDLMGNLELEVL